MGFSSVDYGVFAGYIFFIVALGLWVSRAKKGTERNSSDYFLASKALPWWAIGAISEVPGGGVRLRVHSEDFRDGGLTGDGTLATTAGEICRLGWAAVRC